MGPPPVPIARSKKIDAADRLDFHDSIEHTKGPFRLAINTRKCKLHLLTVSDRALGCVWKLKKDNGKVINSPKALKKLTSASTTQCPNCFYAFKIPDDWLHDDLTNAQTNGTDDESGMSDTDDNPTDDDDC